jgi:hypothetical protein
LLSALSAAKFLMKEIGNGESENLLTIDWNIIIISLTRYTNNV